MSKETLLGSIELTKLNHVVVLNRKSQKGDIIPGLWIPIPHNQIYQFPVKDENGVIQEGAESNRFGFEIRAVVSDEKDQYGRNGFISKKLRKEEYEANKENEKFLKSSQPILGNFIKLAPVNPDAPGNDIPVLDEEDPLPF